MKTIEASEKFTTLCKDGKLIEAADFVVTLPDDSLCAMARGTKVRAIELLTDPSEGFQDRAMNKMEWILANKTKIDDALIKRKQLYLETNGEPAEEAAKEPSPAPEPAEAPRGKKPKRRIRKIKLSDVSGSGVKKAEDITEKEAKKAVEETEPDTQEVDKKEAKSFFMVSSEVKEGASSTEIGEINKKLDAALGFLKKVDDDITRFEEAYNKNTVFLQNLAERVKALSLRSEETQHTLLTLGAFELDVDINQALTIFRNGQKAIQEIQKDKEE